MDRLTPLQPRAGKAVDLKSAVAAATTRGPSQPGPFVPETELPDFDFPTWRVRHRPYDYETDGC